MTTSDTHVIGSTGRAHVADHAETRKRCEGSVHESVGANIRSWRTKFLAYAQ
jgi:hypothetical protein